MNGDADHQSHQLMVTREAGDQSPLENYKNRQGGVELNPWSKSVGAACVC